MKVNEIITNEIIESLSKEIIPWQKPWNSIAPKNIVTNREYSGFNKLYLGTLPYKFPYFATFKQVKAKGGSIKKGAKSEICIFWNIKERQVENKNGKIETKKFPLLRYFKVFNVEYIEGIEFDKELFETNEIENNEIADNIINNYLDNESIEIKNGSNASYNPVSDFITMPSKEIFTSRSGYYSTLFHEMAHSTGHKNRLNRLEATKFGTEKYAKEELVAEITSCFLCGKTGMKKESIENTKAYCQSWIKALKDDKNMIISAAGMAEKAENFIVNGEK